MDPRHYRVPFIKALLQSITEPDAESYSLTGQRLADIHDLRIPMIPATDSEGSRPGSERSDAGHDLCTRVAGLRSDKARPNCELFYTLPRKVHLIK